MGLSMPPISPVVRPEAPHEAARIRLVHEAAFGQTAEADLVDALRAHAVPYLGWVAEAEGAVVAHVCFSPVQLERAPQLRAVGLAPMAVWPTHQRQGIGTALVQAALRACRQAGHEVVVVLGHPAYYPRFGFEVAATKGVICPYLVPPEAFMVLELVPGALDQPAGLVQYHAAFNTVV